MKLTNDDDIESTGMKKQMAKIKNKNTYKNSSINDSINKTINNSS